MRQIGHGSATTTAAAILRTINFSGTFGSGVGAGVNFHL